MAEIARTPVMRFRTEGNGLSVDTAIKQGQIELDVMVHSHNGSAGLDFDLTPAQARELATDLLRASFHVRHGTELKTDRREEAA